MVLEDYCKDSNDTILALIDEGHRTQYGDLADNMRTILPNTCYIVLSVPRF
ncbi:hypothetical protein [Rickettsia amblyommatis]|uniref:hypothetical protein n=1 Tax=Rickettsia amblyommatis TaxID=33989 RepID=UPI0035A1B555